MGNQSSSLNGGLMIQTDKSNYYPNENIKGEVHIIIKKPLKTQKLRVSYLA